MKKFVLLFGSALILGACGSPSSVSTSEASSAESTSAVASSQAESQASAVGKRSNPVPLGTPATWQVRYYDDSSNAIEGTVTVTLSDVVRGEEAFAQLQEVNQYNEPAPEGMEWVVFTVKATLDEGSEDYAFNTMNLSFKPIASDGSEVDQLNNFASLSSDGAFGMKDLYQGGTDEGKVAKVVPVGDNTLLEVNDWNTSVFFSLQ